MEKIDLSLQGIYTLLVGAGLISYLVVVLRTVPAKLFEFILLRIKFSLVTQSNNKETYKAMTSWIKNLNKRVLLNNLHSEAIENYETGKTEYLFSLKEGNYLVFKFPFTFIHINKKKIENTYNIWYNIDCSLFGYTRKLRLQLFDYINKEQDINKIMIYPTGDRWNSYKLTKRTKETLFIKHELKKDIFKNLDIWNNEDTRLLYNSKGIPYKLGILLYGTPGTGKSSLIKIIASYLDFDIQLINLNSYDTENALIHVISNIPKHTIIVFEDIDCMNNHTERKKVKQDNLKEKNKEISNKTPETGSGNAISLSLLLNIIDGVLSPEGVIFIATTNHIDQLDQALIREGRFDLKYELTNFINADIIIEMCNFYNLTERDIERYLKSITYPISLAKVQFDLLHNYNLLKGRNND